MKPVKIRNKITEKEAIQFAYAADFPHIAKFTEGKAVLQMSEDDMDVRILIPTLEGDTFAYLGDWIIKGINGEFYPCKNDIFEKSYEAIE